MSSELRRQRLLVFIVAYNAETTIARVLRRIPPTLAYDYDVEVLVIDDCSRDQTFRRSDEVRASEEFPFKLHVLFNPVNQGYGGNQKIGFHFAIEEGFDFVALVHGDGQYAPECLPELVRPLADGEADAVFGSRMLTRMAALKGGMPLYKYVGNKILTYFQNRLLRTQLSEFHSGYRIYSVGALSQIPFELNTKDFHFDTEIIIQLVIAGMRIKELPIPTYYGDEICYVNGFKYALHVVLTTVQARAQEMSLFYDRKYDCLPPNRAVGRYTPKLGYLSPHTLALAKIKPGARVLDLGCAGGYVGSELRKRGCHVTGIDTLPLQGDVHLDGFIQHDLNAGSLPVGLEDFDWILALDVIEHLISPEAFADQVREAAKFAPEARFIFSTGNVASIWTRIGLLLGQFNYGKRGILDITHTRLFTFATLRRLLEHAGFDVLEINGVPAPFPLVLGDGKIARILLALNTALIRVSRSLFAYQMFMVAKARPSLPYLLRQAQEASSERLASASLSEDSSLLVSLR